MKNKLLHLIKIGMYYSVMGFMLQAILLNTVLAVSTSAQDVKSVREIYISIDLDNLDAIQAFEAIESKTNYKFAYEKRMINRNIKINYKAQNQSLAEILTEISKVTNLKFRQVNNNIDVKKIDHSERNKVERVEIMTQTRTITGTVTAFEDGETLPGVNVLEKGTTNGTVTNLDGLYSLAVSEGATLVFSSVGYTTEEVVVGSSSVLDMVLTQDIQQLGEIVVVAYGTQQKRDLTSSVSSVKAKDLGTQPVSSADALLQGKAAGVQVVQNSGQPGGEVFVRIRGTNSIYGESRPLFVIDGVPMTNIDQQPLGGGGQRFSSLADINPNDIESIEILKDAAAAALYGSRGSNGVVLITTKKGKSGDARINFDAYYGVQNVIKKFDLLQGQDYIDVLNEAQVNAGLSPFSELVLNPAQTNWQDEIFRAAPMSSYNLSVSGGNDRLTSFVSLGYFNQSGTIIGQEFDRINARLNLDYKANNFFKLGTNTTVSLSNTDRVDADFSEFSVLANALYFNPNVPVYNPDGTYGMDPLPSNNDFINENPVMVANDLTHEIVNRRIISNVYGEITFLKNFVLRSTFGIDLLTSRENRFIPSYFQKRENNALSAARFFDEYIWQNENVLQYNNTVGKHSFGALLGYSLLESTGNNFNITGSTTGSDIITSYSAVTPGNNQPQHNIGSWGLQSLFSRFNYSYDDKYLIEGSLRRDASSRFGRNNRVGYFPAISAGWRISSEPFMQPFTDFISDLKLRASVGATGNQDGLNNFASLTQYSANSSYDGQPAIFLQTLGNPDLKWESTITTNIGLDLFLINDRFGFAFDYYVRRTKDLFYTLTLPATTGFTQIDRFNLGSLENSGVEISINTRNLVGEFTWSTDFNIAFNRNKVTELLEVNGITDRRINPVGYSGVEGPYGLFRIGEPVGNFYGYRYLGVWGDPNYSEIPEGWSNLVQKGFAVFEDVDNDFFYGRNTDMQLIGNALPIHTGGITNNFTYKGFDLSIVMNWSYGNEIYNVTRAVMESVKSPRNQLATTLNRWSPENPDGTMPKAFAGSNSGLNPAADNVDASSRFIEDGSFLRVRNLTLGYNLPEAISSKAGLASARLYVSGQNLLTFTNYTGLDPESQNLGTATGGVPALGVDFLTQPLPRVFMIGVNVGL